MKNKAIEIIKNLNMTIKKLHKVKDRVSKANNEVFKNPSASVSQLEQKRTQLISKYKLKKKDYEVTYS
tara:strand:+ start:94 stop:297 length:204 start_codon:yes stop_codon:yes gene_type:complete